MMFLASAEGATFDLVLVGVLVAVAAFLIAAYRSGIPYPILLVVGGAGLGFLPGSPDTVLDPRLVLVVFLPPLLYSAAFFSSLRDLRDNVRPISILAIGLVTATTIVVGVVAHELIDGLNWAAAFTLGAVLSPTDPVAATAIAGRVGAPRRFVSIVEGESLVNDATALIAYRFAIAATLSGTFSLSDAIGTFVVSAIGGVAIGLAIGVVITEIRRRIDDAQTEITISLLTPYFAYLPAEAAGVSAVLAAVTAGIYLGWNSPALITPMTRIQAFSFWEILIFVLNATLFILVGLELPHVMHAARESYGDGTLALYGVVIALTVVLIRFLWIYPTAYLPRTLSRRVRESAPPPDVGQTVLVAFTGMRGAVSLAAALAIPLHTDSGALFPGRDLIVFLVYVTVVFTVVIQGLTLGPLIRWLSVPDEEEDIAAREAKARIRSARAAIEHIDALLADEEEDWVREESAERMRRLYEYRMRRFGARFDDDDDGDIEAGSQAYQRLRAEVLGAERAEIIRLRNTGTINDEIMRRLERDLDLEHARLEN
jgi:CPA1 family monovalent cation:H+ antiporter